MKRWKFMVIRLLVVLGATYLYYTEIKPVVIFGLRSVMPMPFPSRRSRTD